MNYTGMQTPIAEIPVTKITPKSALPSQLQHEAITAFVLARGAVGVPIVSPQARLIGLWLAMLEVGSALLADEFPGEEVPGAAVVQLAAMATDRMGPPAGLDPDLLRRLEMAAKGVSGDALDGALRLDDLEGDDLIAPDNPTPLHPAWVRGAL